MCYGCYENENYFCSSYSTINGCKSGSPGQISLIPTNKCLPADTSRKLFEMYSCDSKGYSKSVYSDASCQTVIHPPNFTPFNNTCSKTVSSSNIIQYNTMTCTSDAASTSSSSWSTSTFLSSFPLYAIILVAVVLVLLLIGGAIAFFLLREERVFTT